MAKICFTICLLLTSIFCSNGQNPNDYFNIQDYKNDVALKLHARNHSQFVVSQYGVVKNQLGANYNYFFQGQEFDHDLGLYFFPSRMYSAKKKRFFQPDPASQFFSPYLFVMADPVNHTDQDGNVAKPLVLYGEESRTGGATRMSAVAEDMQKEVDGYYYPLSDFVNGDVPLDLKEWNGNVFIEGHLHTDGSISSEFYLKGEKFKLNKRFSEGIYDGYEGVGKFGFVQHNALSERLARLTKSTKVALKKVTFGGCEGGQAAKKLSRSIGKVFRKMKAMPGKVTTSGLQEGLNAGFMSPAVNSEINAGLLETPGNVIGTPPNHLQMYMQESEDGELTADYSGVETEYSGENYIYPHIEGDEFRGFVNGEVPQDFANNMDFFETNIPNSAGSRVPRSSIRSLEAPF